MIQLTIRPLAAADRDAAVHVINTAARWYRDFLPPEDLHDPEMTAAQWEDEARRLAWYGGFVDENLVGVMGLERVRDAALLRHAYILPEHQHHGIGLRLVEHLELAARREAAAGGVRRIIVGTYARNHKARGALEKAGYRPSEDPAAVLRAYYAVPEDRLRASITYEKPAVGAERGNMPNPPRAQILRIADLVEYQAGSVVSRIVVKAEAGSVTLFAFDEGQDLSEHTVPFDALAHVLDGEVEIKISGAPFHLRAGDAIVMPANQPHAVRAVGRFKMLLTMLRA